MFDDLQQKISYQLRKIANRNIIREDQLQQTVDQIKILLLQADVNYRVVNAFLREVKKKTVGREIGKGLTSAQVFISIVHKELQQILGKAEVGLNPPINNMAIILLLGLQGSGKTSSAGKLGYFLKQQNKKVLVTSIDTYRPAAIKQLQILCEQANVDFHPTNLELSTIQNATNAAKYALDHNYNHLIIDTQGRSQINEQMMKELDDLNKQLVTSDRLLVVDAMVGQQALGIAQKFNSLVNITGFILTKVDGDAKGGAMISMRSVTNKPIKFIGDGEKIADLRPFNPHNISANILGLSNVQELLDKLARLEKEQLETTQSSNKANSFNLIDLENQLAKLESIGIKSLLNAMPRNIINNSQNISQDENLKEMKKMSYILKSMTKLEKIKPDILNGSRKQRIALGSGTKVSEVNKLLKKFNQMKHFTKKFSKIKDPTQLKRSFGSYFK